MSILSGISDFFGLDIGTSAIRVVQLRGRGNSKSLIRYGASPLDDKISMSDSSADLQKLASQIREALKAHRIGTKNVAVGLSSSKVFSTIVDIERLSPSELEKNLTYQADSLIPTPVQDSKLDWAVIGDSPKDHSKIEVLISSVTNEFIERRLDMLESMGLNVIAFEPDSLALSRALVVPGTVEAQMIVDIGAHFTDVIVIMNDAPRLTRTISTGSDAIIKAAMQNLGIDQKQAEQFVFKFGLNKDKLEGQIFTAISPTIEILFGEIEKSIKFFEARYVNIGIKNIIVTGGASALPEFPLQLANRFKLNVEIGNAWRNVSYSQSRQNELLAVSNHFGVAVGLAMRSE